MDGKYASILSEVILFQGIEPENLETLLGCLKPRFRDYRKNEYMAVAGESMEGLGILVRGEAIVLRENAAGNRVMMTLLQSGDLFGEMAVFSDEPAWPASVVAQQTATALYSQGERVLRECQKLCPWHNSLIRNLLGILSERALLLNKKVEYLTMKSLRGKISAFLLDQSRKAGGMSFTLPMNRAELADFLNVSRPSMSREMCRMRDEGVIDFHLASIRILDPEALKGMVE